MRNTAENFFIFSGHISERHYLCNGFTNDNFLCFVTEAYFGDKIPGPNKDIGICSKDQVFYKITLLQELLAGPFLTLVAGIGIAGVQQGHNQVGICLQACVFLYSYL